MKSIKIWSVALLGSMIMAPAWSHHPAEGIISDDLWNRINDHLIAVDSPHVLIDFDDMMGSMRLQDDSNYGCQLLVTSLTVPEVYAYEYAAQVEYTIDELMDEMGEQNQNVSAGSERQPCNAPGFEVVDQGDGTAEILFYEPMGAMTGQRTASPASPPEAPAATPSASPPETPPASPPATPPANGPGKGGH